MNYMKRTQIYLEETHLKDLADMNKDSGISMSEIIRTIINDHLDEYVPNKPENSECVKQRTQVYLTTNQREKLKNVKKEFAIKISISEILRQMLTKHLDEYYPRFVKNKYRIMNRQLRKGQYKL